MDCVLHHRLHVLPEMHGRAGREKRGVSKHPDWVDVGGGAVLIGIALIPFDLPLWSLFAIGGVWGLLISVIKDSRR